MLQAFMKPQDHSVSLWQQLQASADVLRAVQRGTSGSAALESVPPALRPGVQALSFQVWRNLGRAQALCQRLAARTPAPPVRALICVALALTWDDTQSPYDAHTLVNQAVEAAKRSLATRAQAGFVNACLRRFLRERDALVLASSQDPVALWNHPAWWIARLQHDHPQQWQQLLRAANRHPPLALRVNLLQGSVSDYLQELARAGIAARAAGDAGIVLERAVPVQQLPGFASGRVSVQDLAAQRAAPLLLHGLLPIPGSAAAAPAQPVRVLDACAAPGGKTGQLLEWGAQVMALDVDAVRCARITQNLQRLGLQAQVVRGDAGDSAQWWDGVPFDAILLDAPCTASGIVRRHPDVRWLRRESDIAQLAAQQSRLLQALWPLLKPGGRLLYCTCSLFLAEGSAQVQTFLAHNTDATLLPSPGHLVPQKQDEAGALPDNPSGDHDGFFYALLRKHLA